MVKLWAGRLTRAQRAKARSSVQLDDAALTEKTRVRYYNALRKLLPTFESVHDEDDLDASVCDWVRHMWETGEPLLTVGDALSALHFYQPWTKRRLAHSWKLFGTWRKIEHPARAPPLTLRITRSLAAYAVASSQWELAVMLLLGFECLLRTGELMALYPEDLLLGATTGLCTLRNTKTSKRDSAQEVISINDSVTLELCKQFLKLRKEWNTPTMPLWSASPGAFRRRFAQLCCIFGLEPQGFRPYSLRRGGATHTFQVTQSMESALLRGRWQSSRVARVYITDGLSYLPSLKMTAQTKRLLNKYFFLNPTDG